MRALLDARTIGAAQIVAPIGKREGAGFARRLAAGATARLLTPCFGCMPEEAEGRFPMVWSVGADGVISPHATIFTRDDAAVGDGQRPRLALGAAFTGTSAPPWAR